MTEHNLEKTSKYIETNPSKQPPKEEIRTISPHKNPNKNQPNPKNLSKEFILSSPNTQNRTTSLTETEHNQMESKTITKPLNKTYLIENANQKRSKSSQRSTSKNRTKNKIKSSPGKVKQSENYKNINKSTPPPLDRMETEDTKPTNHNQPTNQTWRTKHPTIDYNLNNRCANCNEDHPSYTRSCPAWKKKKNLNYKNPKNSWRLHKKTKPIPKSSKTTQNQRVKKEKTTKN